MCLGWLRGSHLYQIIFPVLCTTDLISQILEDFQSVSLDHVIDDTIGMLQGSVRSEVQRHFYNCNENVFLFLNIYHCLDFEQFENLVEIDFSFDSILKWTQDVVDNDWMKVAF